MTPLTQTKSTAPQESAKHTKKLTPAGLSSTLPISAILAILGIFFGKMLGSPPVSRRFGSAEEHSSARIRDSAPPACADQPKSGEEALLGGFAASLRALALSGPFSERRQRQRAREKPLFAAGDHADTPAGQFQPSDGGARPRAGFPVPSRPNKKARPSPTQLLERSRTPLMIVGPRGLDGTVLAHEWGHSCGLLHRGLAGNPGLTPGTLMEAAGETGSVGLRIDRYERALLMLY